ncbi:MAG: hypothetical protein HC852_06800 [Acaryochloridaceae cyanobacterium RU_4_10]|nr:hypothetical protein [Acaryochloridaceae cyanobacterium RU_4_10]
MKRLERPIASSLVLAALLVSAEMHVSAETAKPKATSKTPPKTTPKTPPKPQPKPTSKTPAKVQPQVDVKTVPSDRFLFASCTDPTTKKPTLNIVISKEKSERLSTTAGLRLALLETGAKTSNTLKFIAGTASEQSGAGHRYLTLHGIGLLTNSNNKAAIDKIVVDTASDGQTSSTRITVNPANAPATDTGNTLENCKVNNVGLLMKVMGR